MKKEENWKIQVMAVSGVLGAVCGLLAGYILVQTAEKEQVKPQLSAGDGVKIGLGVLGLLRLIAEFGVHK